MTSISEKLAALRAKRNPAQRANPLIAHALSVAPNPHISWDTDYKTRIRSSPASSCRPAASSAVPDDQSSCSSDDSGAELVVLPPPVRKLNSTAQRRLWRIKEIGRAKEKAVKSIIESRPDAFLQSNLHSLQPSPVSEDDGNPDDPAEPPGENDNDNEEQNGEWKDEEEVALESAYTLQEQAVDPNPDHSRSAPDNPSQSLTPPEQPCPQSSDMTGPDPEPQKSGDHPDPQVNSTHELPEEHHLANAASKMPAADENTAQKARAVSPDSSSAPRGPRQEDESPENIPSPAAGLGPTVAGPPTRVARDSAPLRPSGFIEDEAEDDEDNSGRDLSATPERDDSVDDDHALADGVDENEVSPAERQKLAAFHQKWLLEKETEEVNTLRADPRSMLDKEDDEFMASALKTKVPEAATAQEGGAASGSEVAEGDFNVDLDLDDGSRPANYVESMFLRDDSRCQYFAEEENSDGENGKQDMSRREKARALWKARQKIKADLFQEDENSLSRFDIFGDADHSRSALIRAQLEGACRPVSKKIAEERAAVGSDRDKTSNKLKRSLPWSSGKQVVDLKRHSSLAHKEDRKRQRSVSIGRWSFSSFHEKPTSSNKPLRSSSSKAANSSAASYNPRKPRTRSNPSSHRNPAKKVAGSSLARKGKDRKASFKGLFGALSARAESYDE